jgi:hypothetical protein
VSWAYGALVVLAAVAVAAWLVLGAMRRTARRQQAGLPPLPRCGQAREPVLRALGARYLGTTYAPSPVRRFSGHGLLGRGIVDLAADREGLRVESGPAGPWCLPAGQLLAVVVTSGHAGKMFRAERVLVVDWRLGGTALRSGFALDDEPTARRWAAWLTGMTNGNQDREGARR